MSRDITYLDAIREAVTEKTKAVLINSPNNPTGKVYDSGDIGGLAALLTERGAEYGREIYLISDEPYSEIVYDGLIVPSVLAAYPHSLIASSYSKSLSLPGERIGYIAVNPAITGIGQIMGGLTLSNRILGRFVDRIFISFADSALHFPRGKTLLTGSQTGRIPEHNP